MGGKCPRGKGKNAHVYWSSDFGDSWMYFSTREYNSWFDFESPSVDIHLIFVAFIGHLVTLKPKLNAFWLLQTKKNQKSTCGVRTPCLHCVHSNALNEIRGFKKTWRGSLIKGANHSKTGRNQRIARDPCWSRLEIRFGRCETLTWKTINNLTHRWTSQSSHTPQ